MQLSLFLSLTGEQGALGRVCPWLRIPSSLVIERERERYKEREIEGVREKERGERE
jgi:hypothetical protein